MDAIVDRVSVASEVLDVACGTGATTFRIAERLRPSSLIGIGISHSQLSEARQRVPTAGFGLMDASRLGFRTDSFDAVVCVEAAFHFVTRAQFLREALLVLRPGGILTMSDILLARGAALSSVGNYLEGCAAYAALLEQTGFVDIEVRDVTDRTWRPFRRRFTDFIARRHRRSPFALRDLFAANVVCAWAVRHCVLVRARKPDLRSSASQLAV